MLVGDTKVGTELLTDSPATVAKVGVVSVAAPDHAVHGANALDIPPNKNVAEPPQANSRIGCKLADPPDAAHSGNAACKDPPAAAPGLASACSLVAPPSGGKMLQNLPNTAIVYCVF